MRSSHSTTSKSNFAASPDKPLKILTAVAWWVEKAGRDDLSKLSADVFVKSQGYWFLKNWPRKQDDIDVIGLSRSKVLNFIERKLLKFYPFQAVKIFAKMRSYDLAICFHSQIGIPLGLFFALFKIEKPIILMDVEGLGRKVHWSYRWLMNQALKKVALIFYFSSVQYQDYQANYPEILPRCRFLHLGMDPERFQQNNVPQENYLVAVGYQKRNFRDWEALVHAYNQLSTDVPLVIVGKKGFTRMDFNHETPIPRGIRFIDKVSFSELNKIVGKSSFVILPLPERRHSYGAITLLGAQALGKAVLTSRCSGVKDYVQEGQTGFFYDTGDAADLAQQLVFMLEHPELVNTVGLKARDAVQHRFSEAQMGASFFSETAEMLFRKKSESRAAD